MAAERPTFLEIDLARLERNFRRLKTLAGASKFLCSIKANAYGHGLETCAKTLILAGADYLGVALAEEGIALRRAGITAPILVFGGVLGEQVDEYLGNDLEITASSVFKLREIEARALALGKRARVHLKIDTGMGRIGVQHDRAQGLLQAAQASKTCDVIGIFSHFASSDSEDLSFARLQLQRFVCVAEQAEAILGYRPLRHIANSAALLQLPESILDMVRPGIALFGVAPTRRLQGCVALEPVLSLRSTVVYFKVLAAGDGVSYGPTWRAPCATRVLTIPLGYGDGFHRLLSNRCQILLRGKRFAQVGAICMDQFMVNLGLGEAQIGESVVVLGEQGTESIDVHQLAEAAQTIPYEILTSLNVRLPRVYVGT